jgi:hypothetical protein
MKALYLEGIRFSMKKTALGVKGLMYHIFPVKFSWQRIF